MLFGLLDKIERHNINESIRRHDEEEKRKAEAGRDRINELSKAEVERLSKNPIVDKIYKQIFNHKCAIEKFSVGCDGVNVRYVDGTSAMLEFKHLGMERLPGSDGLPGRDTRIFDSDPLVLSANWDRYGYLIEEYQVDETIEISDTYFYLYFCEILRQNNDSDLRTLPHFNYCLALGHILAEKTGLKYRRPYRIKFSSCSSTMGTEFIFDTQAKLKSW